MLWIGIIILLLLLIVGSFVYDSPGLGIFLIIVLIFFVIWRLNLMNQMFEFVTKLVEPKASIE